MKTGRCSDSGRASTVCVAIASKRASELVSVSLFASICSPSPQLSQSASQSSPGFLSSVSELSLSVSALLLLPCCCRAVSCAGQQQQQSLYAQEKKKRGGRRRRWATSSLSVYTIRQVYISAQKKKKKKMVIIK